MPRNSSLGVMPMRRWTVHLISHKNTEFVDERCSLAKHQDLILVCLRGYEIRIKLSIFEYGRCHKPRHFEKISPVIGESLRRNFLLMTKLTI